ncbi:type II toxin-antitoxin system RelB/DinJ family antitoxin [Cupriavidus sp. USMAHM13]|uniref:type II toxin-antitoxin system RelB/DinJ family antitoxin n=1 Tax=Cupriavidus sp. USMAHM13 TaxID=1389192 RepID=UPI0009F5E0CF|nr:type II toxin-antitoxin system RelB/DinJ family antitoxin [Cupriavidus sp. USMAHM13]
MAIRQQAPSRAPVSRAKAPSDYVRARIPRDVKADATTVLAAMGLSVSDALRMLLMRIAQEKRLPAGLFVPNEETVAAMRGAIEGRTVKARSVTDLMAQLNQDD